MKKMVADIRPFLNYDSIRKNIICAVWRKSQTIQSRILQNNYSDAVLVHILKHNLDETDLSKLFQNYTNYGLEVQHEILVIAKIKLIKLRMLLRM